MTDTAKPKIYSDLVALRKHIGGLEAKKAAGVMFPIKNAKELMIKLRAGLDDLNMVSYVAEMAPQDIPMAPDKNGKIGSGCLVYTKVTMVSDDGSFVVFCGVGHGFDRDDKAAGKASTYAWKDAIIKGLNLPDAEMASVTTATVDTDDESDIPVNPKRSPKAGEVAAIAAALLVATTAEEVEALSVKTKALKPSREDALPLSQAFAEARARVSKG